MNEDFGIGPGLKYMAAHLKILLQLQEIINFAIVYDPNRSIFVAHRLVARRGKINNTQSPVAKHHCSFRVPPHPAVVRPTMSKQVASINPIFITESKRQSIRSKST